MRLDEMRLCLQQQINIAAAAQLGKFAALQRILLGFQCHKRQPVCFLLQCVLRRVLTFVTTMLLVLQITTLHSNLHTGSDAPHLQTTAEQRRQSANWSFFWELFRTVLCLTTVQNDMYPNTSRVSYTMIDLDFLWNFPSFPQLQPVGLRQN